MEPKKLLFVIILKCALALYVVMVAANALYKAASTAQSERVSWAEVFYGPAITVVSSYSLPLAAMGVEHLIRARKGRN